MDVREFTHTVYIWSVPKGIQIVYADVLTGKLEVKPYLDIKKSRSVWGIAVNGTAFKKTHAPLNDWYKAFENRDAKPVACLPDTHQLDSAFAHKEAFNDTVAILNHCGIAAEPWQDAWYWSHEDNPAEAQATVVDMTDGTAKMVDKRMRNGYVRLCTRNFGEPKAIMLGYNPIYRRPDEDFFRSSVELVKEGIPYLWGLHLDKDVFLAVKNFVNCNWYQGNEEAAKRSTTRLQLYLPTQAVWRDVEQYRDAINSALLIARAYGAEVELLDKKTDYLTLDSYDDKFITFWHQLIPKTQSCPCRFAGKTLKGKTEWF